MFNFSKKYKIALTRTNVLDKIKLSKGSVDMQKVLCEYRGVILVLLVLFLGLSLMSINVRKLENSTNVNQVNIYEK